MNKRRKRHNPEQIVRKLRDADAMLTAGKDLASVLQPLEVSESTYLPWRNQYGGMKSEEAKRLKQLEDENKRLKELVAGLSLDNKMLKYISEGNWKALPENELPSKRSRMSSVSLSGELVWFWISLVPLSVTSRAHAVISRPWSNACMSWCGHGPGSAIAGSPGCCSGKAGTPVSPVCTVYGVGKG